MKFSLKKQSLCLIALFALTVGCDEPKMIPDDKLEAIITDVLLTEGVLSSGMKLDYSSPLDSTDFYGPVLRKYGYSTVDFRYTISEMASRKSNPLEVVMTHVVDAINKQATLAQYRFDVARRFDSLAISAYIDTVYRNDTTIVGSLKKFRIRLDSVKSGNYKFTMDYRTMVDYRLPQKSMKYNFASEGKNPYGERHIWLNRTEKTRTLEETITTNRDRDSLMVYFDEALPNRKKEKREKLPKDTSMIQNILIVYTPLLTDARTRYYNSLLGIDFTEFSDLRKNDEPKLKKDSLPGPIRFDRESTPAGDRRVRRERHAYRDL